MRAHNSNKSMFNWVLVYHEIVCRFQKDSEEMEEMLNEEISIKTREYNELQELFDEKENLLKELQVYKK